MNLPEALFGPEPLTIRRVATLVRGLPPDSATVLAYAERIGPPHDTPRIAEEPTKPTIPASGLLGIIGGKGKSHGR